MDETKIIQCPCGQESQLVFLDDRWRYDMARHGNGEPCEGKCFNCRAPLKDDDLFPADGEPAEASAPVDEPVDEARASMSMTKNDLLGMAEAMAIEVPKGSTKADMLELIEQAEPM